MSTARHSHHAFASALLRVAAWLLPRERADWAQAMRSELDQIDNGGDALEWAAGCLLACAWERLRMMTRGNLTISRWLLAPEMLLCFAPLTLGWIDALTGASGIMHLNMEIIRKDFLGVPEGGLVLTTLITWSIIGVLGPVTLFIALRLLLTGYTVRNSALRFVLIAGPVAIGVLALVCRAWSGDAGAFSPEAVDAFDFWSGILLCSVLPALGAAHLLHFGTRPEQVLAA